MSPVNGREDAFHCVFKMQHPDWQQEPRQSSHKCLEHLITLVVRTIENNTSRVHYGEADSKVSAKEAAQFLKKRRAKAEIELKTSERSKMDEESILEALQKVKKRFDEPEMATALMWQPSAHSKRPNMASVRS